MVKTCVFGGGAWGTAIAQHMALQGNEVRLVLRDVEQSLCDTINSKHENVEFLPEMPLSELVEASCDPAYGVENVEMIFFVVPTQFLRAFARNIHPALPLNVPIVNCSKGFEIASQQTGSEILKEELPGKYHAQLAVLSGPNFAREISKGMPANTTVASANPDTAKAVQAAVSTKLFRAYTSKDMIGVETGGAAKNVIAIAAGASDGLKLGTSARASLITRGLAEMTRLAVKRGGDPLTLAGQSGVGDLVLTATGDLSRNRTLGFEIGQGKSIEEILGSRNSVAEGYKTSKAIVELATRLEVDMPISTEVYKVLHEGKPLMDAFASLSARPVKDELTDLE